MNPSQPQQIQQVDADALLKQGMISEDTYNKMVGMQAPTAEVDSAGNPIKYGAPSKDIREILPNVPKDASIVAGIDSWIPGVETAKDVGFKAVDTLHNAANYQQQNGTQIPVFDSNQNLTKDVGAKLPERFNLSSDALKNIGQTEEKEVGKVVPGLMQNVDDVLFQNRQNQMEIQDNLKKYNELSDIALRQLQEFKAKATINPNQYIQNMGTGQKTLTALGLVLSGMGAGLTGQPNMAQEMLQKNIDRDIAAQAKSYENDMQNIAGLKGLAESRLNTSQMRMLAQNMAGITVYTGLQAQLQALQTQIQGKTAKDRATLLDTTNQTVLLKHMLDYDSLNKGLINSNDAKNLDLMGVGIEALLNKVNGKAPSESPAIRAKGYQNQIQNPEQPKVNSNTPQPPSQNNNNNFLLDLKDLNNNKDNKSKKPSLIDKMSEKYSNNYKTD